jgi:hypothetical protein
VLVEGNEKRAAFFQFPQAIKPDGVEPLKDVTLLAVLGGVPVFLVEPNNVLEPGDDPFFSRRIGGLLRLRHGKVGEFRPEFVKSQISHIDLRGRIA